MDAIAGNITITRESDADSRAGICRDLLAALPDWFGLPESNARFEREVRDLPMWVARLGGKPVGFATTRQHFPATAELHLIAIDPAHHRQGIGARLVAALEAHLRGN